MVHHRSGHPGLPEPAGQPSQPDQSGQPANKPLAGSGQPVGEGISDGRLAAGWKPSGKLVSGATIPSLSPENQPADQALWTGPQKAGLVGLSPQASNTPPPVLGSSIPAREFQMPREQFWTVSPKTSSNPWEGKVTKKRAVLKSRLASFLKPWWLLWLSVRQALAASWQKPGGFPWCHGGNPNLVASQIPCPRSGVSFF